jgi:hypothetical protein
VLARRRGRAGSQLSGSSSGGLGTSSETGGTITTKKLG